MNFAGGQHRPIYQSDLSTEKYFSVWSQYVLVFRLSVLSFERAVENNIILLL